MRLTATMIALFTLGAGVLLLGWLGPSEEQRFDVVQEINQVGARDGWLALGSLENPGDAWQTGALAWRDDGLSPVLIVALSDTVTEYAPGMEDATYFARLEQVYCDRLWPIVVEHLGRRAKVEIHAWDEELRAPERSRESLSSVIGNLPLDCTTGARFR